jgi:hypothetical protein
MRPFSWTSGSETWRRTPTLPTRRLVRCSADGGSVRSDACRSFARTNQVFSEDQADPPEALSTPLRRTLQVFREDQSGLRGGLVRSFRKTSQVLAEDLRPPSGGSGRSLRETFDPLKKTLQVFESQFRVVYRLHFSISRRSFFVGRPVPRSRRVAVSGFSTTGVWSRYIVRAISLETLPVGSAWTTTLR